jgi:acyl transferase domain-containing protein/NADPH:quinone reductase-like Zn-dependent oxidoreductase/NADP-dependent 3-hydroxy acid dehydrogenase YdfG/acyl carrier protein
MESQESICAKASSSELPLTQVSERGPEHEVSAEPIAIVGIGCRFPHADGVEAFWRLMRDGVDAITEVPAERFDINALYDPRPSVPGKLITRFGGFLAEVDKFDPYFFGISPREAAHMDPQQRLLLEVSWEAMDDAGLLANAQPDSSGGVFIGMVTNDYEDIQFRELYGINIYTLTGGARSVASGRLSYMLGWQGPSLTVDTACSSSLVAVHLACQSLRNGESSLALAGGVNLVLQPEHSLGFSYDRMLASDGRCKFGDAGADGFVRSDGAGVVVLKPLARALADGDRIYALIRGSAVNNDGRTGGFLMTPSRQGQEALLRTAYRHAGISPASVQYVEAHGTGTSVGDPTEVKALGNVLAPGRNGTAKCLIGSVKTNIGHTEGAAGIAGLIKVALSLKHRAIPPSLHLREPNPNIPWQELPFVVPQELTAWPAVDGAAYAAVSAFGISGTNAHVVLEGVPGSLAQDESGVPGRAQLLTLSAHCAEALRAMAERYRASLTDEADDGASLSEVCYTAGVKRVQREHRLAVAGRSRAELSEHLEAFLKGESRSGLSYGDVSEVLRGGRQSSSKTKVAFVFPGQGSQWPGMGRALLEQEPVFLEILQSCETAMRKFVDWSLLEQLTMPPESSRLCEIDVIQPTLFAIQVALAGLWRSWGVEPDAVVGHSMGEVAAAHVAGSLRLEDAARVICRRSRLLRRVSGRGAMAVVELSPAEAERLLVNYTQRLSIAVCNSPASTVLSGDPEALEEVLEHLRQEEIFCRLIKVDVASHSPQMEPLRPDLLAALRGLKPKAASVPIYSTVNGRLSDGLEYDAVYWVRNLREPVLFSTATQRLIEDGHHIFIEISPNPILLPAVQQLLRHVGQDGLTLASMRHEEDERSVMLSSLGALHVSGYGVDWSKLFPGGGKCVSLPGYCWQRERFWIESELPAGTGPQRWFAARDRQHEQSAHPLLARRLKSALETGTYFWETDLSIRSLPYLNDHRVRELIVLPAAAYIEAALAAASEIFGAGVHTLRNFVFKKALFLTEEESRTVQIVLSPERAGEVSFRLFSLSSHAEESSNEWTLHATGTIRTGDACEAPSPIPPAQVRERCAEAVSGAAHYEAMSARALHYGPSFQCVEAVWRRPCEAIGRVRLPVSLEPQTSAYGIHPALLDACLQVLAATLPGGDAASGRAETYLPVGFDELRLYAQPPLDEQLWSYTLLHAEPAAGAEMMTGDVFLLGPEGQLLLEARNLRLQRLEKAAEHASAQSFSDWLYEVRWQLQPVREQSKGAALAERGKGRLIFVDDKGVGAELRSLLEARGEDCTLVFAGESYECLEAGRYRINPARPADFDRLLHDISGAKPLALGSIVHLWSLNAVPHAETTLETFEVAPLLACGSTLHLIQALSKREGMSPRLWLVTGGSRVVGEDFGDVEIAQAPLWGMGRVIDHEHPELRCTRVDLSGKRTPEELEVLCEELLSDGEETEIALRGAARFVARLTRSATQATPDGPEAPAVKRTRAVFGEQPFRLEIMTPGILDELTLRSTRRRAPGPGEVEIQVYAAGLNFRDVMIAMGVLPPVSNEGPIELGWECTGRITAVGAGVETLRPGDEVIAIAPGCFRAFVITSASLVVPKPARLDFQQGATIPIVFMTTYYALHHLGRMSKGERVLIHAATGGVGLAAIQLAQAVGAEIFATAGSPDKRAYLQSLGVRHVYDSRTLAFAEEVLRDTNGEGVDLVLNSLAGEAIPKSISILNTQGRFFELGRTDILQNTSLGLQLFEKNISFFAIDLAQMFMSRPEVCGRLFREMIQFFEQGTFAPIPARVFPIGEVTDAFRFLGQAKHIGKIVLSMENQETFIEEAPELTTTFSADATYLITGGCGGLGLTFARWMVERGARHLVLTGRSGASTSAQEVIDELAQAEAHVRVMKADVAQRQQVVSLLDEIRQSMPPLKGIIHAAGLLDDGLLLQQNLERFKSVMAPKVSGAWNLHSLTLDDPLEFFVLFSSAAATLGSPGQGNYSAANAFLDALAHHRRAQGRCALSIDWGPWAEVGLAARPDRGGRLALRGLKSLTPQQGVNVLAPLLKHEAAQISVMSFDFEQWAQFYTTWQLPYFSELVAGRQKEQERQAQVKQNGSNLRDALLAVEPGGRRRAQLESYLQEQVAHVLKLSPSRIDAHKPFGSFGLDSLMALEFRNRLEAGLGRTFSATMVWNHPTVAALASHVAAKMGIELDSNAPSTAAEAACEEIEPQAVDDFEALLSEIEKLPDAEARRIFAEEL